MLPRIKTRDEASISGQTTVYYNEGGDRMPVHVEGPAAFCVQYCQAMPYQLRSQTGNTTAYPLSDRLLKSSPAVAG